MNIWCVGRNYADHARELGNSVPASPLIFLKAGSSVVAGSTLSFPAQVGVVHYETELALEFDAHLQVVRAAVALDLTARDLQNALKAKGDPWTMAKSFRNACALGAFAPVANWEQLQSQGEVKFWVNGELKQHGHFADMIFPIHTLVEYVKAIYPIEPGDLLLTGTPAGVGPLHMGDNLRAEIPGLPPAQWRVNS